MALDGANVGSQLVAIVRDYMERSLAQVRENISGLVQRADKHGLQLESLEHRASRQASHLQNLQDRIKALETKADK